MRVVIVIQCRLSSSRMPNKALTLLGGRPLIKQMIRRLTAVKGADGVVVACPQKDAGQISRAIGTYPIVGPEEDVLTRMLIAARETEADKIVKVGADCPLVPPDMISQAIEKAKGQKLVQNWLPRVHPDGFDFDIWDVDYLHDLDKRLTGADREWFASWAAEHDGPGLHMPSNVDLSRLRLTVDYPEDLEVVRALYDDQGDEVWGTALVLRWCFNHPEMMKKNEKYVKDFGARPK